MDKVLKLYKIPEQSLIMAVVAVLDDDSLPEDFSAGDLVINRDDTNGWMLWNAVSSEGIVSWVQIPFDNDLYYRDTSSDSPKFYVYDNGELETYETDFPDSGKMAEITSFTYGSSRMGNAPTISGTLMYRQCLDELWDDRVCTFFNKVFYFIDKIPSSEYTNTDQRYKHNISFVSERVLLENVFFMNIVDSSSVEEYAPVSQWLDFSFFGGISEFAVRLNESMKYSGLYDIGFRVVVDDDSYTTNFISGLEEPDKMISISETTLKSALDMIYDTWGVPYYFDGYVAHLGFSNEPQMQQAGVTMPTFRYGSTDSLLTIQKNQSNEIINRITGMGGTDNLPYFYPNKNPNGLELQYMRNSVLMNDYARIANPYRLVGVSESENIQSGVPDGSYFKYMPIIKTYTYDQFVSVNLHTRTSLTWEDGGVPQLALGVIEDYNIQSRFFIQPYGGSVAIIGHANAHNEYDIICKRVFIWLEDGEFVSMSIKDRMDINDVLSSSGTILYDGSTITGYVHISYKTYTREVYEHVIGSGQGFSPTESANIVGRYFHPVTQGTSTKYIWDDGTVTDTYDEIFPIEVSSLPSNATCIEITVGIQCPYGASYTENALTRMRHDTQTVVTHTVETDPDWSMNADGHAIVGGLYRYGIRVNDGVTPIENDIIYFTKDADYVGLFSSSLIPYNYRVNNDIWLNAVNGTYLKEGSQSQYYSFENIYKRTFAKEGVRNHEDIIPTIKGMMNNQTPSRSIDKIRDIAFDADDNNEKTADGTAYKHPYFYVKLARTSMNDGYGFNLFDCAIEGETMKLRFNDGGCGGCSFDVMVSYLDNGFARNPIAVFTEATTINGVTYPAGTPMRDNNGNVRTSNVPYQESQQDTSASEVWIALRKDDGTFGDLVFPRHTSSNDSIEPSTDDSFVILNINLPFAYVIAAEQRQYYALLDDLENENKRRWSFNIKFSSIYYKKNYELMDKWLNESSIVPFVYNAINRRYYVQSYTYKMSNTSSLPEVTIELQEKIRKKNNWLYPEPVTPNTGGAIPFSSDTLKTIRKAVLNDDNDGFAYPNNVNFDNIRVLGDITLANGTSLNTQILAINSRIQSESAARTREYAWGEVSKRADIENLFVDGVFATDYNEEKTNGVRISGNGSGIVGENSIRAVFEDDSSYFTFDQIIYIEELTPHTIAFYAKAESDDSLTVVALCYNEKEELLKDFSFDFDITNSWGHKAASFVSPDEASYMLLKFAYSGKNTSVYIDIDGVSVYDDIYTSYDQNYGMAVSSMLPTRYKMSTRDIFNAIDKLGGGSGLREVLVCTITIENNAYVCNVSASEIKSEFQAGKLVIFKHQYSSSNSFTYYCTEVYGSGANLVIKAHRISTSSNDTTIYSISVYELRYVNEAWNVIQNPYSL